MDMCFANIYAQSIACIFTLLAKTFTEQMFLIWMKPEQVISISSHQLGFGYQV